MPRRLPEAAPVDHLFHQLQNRAPKTCVPQRVELEAAARPPRTLLLSSVGGALVVVGGIATALVPILR